MEGLERHWGVVFQQNGLFSGTTYDNIALALRAVQGLSEKTIRRIVDQVITAVDPQLSQLLFQGGSTPTTGLGPASPAHTAVPLADCVDRSGNQLLFDQRDVLRTLYDGSGMPQYCDLGAFQGSSDVIFIDSFE